ncbi:hypothetical protein, partial [Methanoculleus sp. UBA291]|uniref:hypothetical protein n=1 Tax=Methanoculleus sp. UBA291 TaxID=1915495 RepID=UPI00316ABD3C
TTVFVGIQDDVCIWKDIVLGEVEVTYLHFHAGTREKREAQRTLSGCGCGFEEFVEKVIPKHLS